MYYKCHRHMVSMIPCSLSTTYLVSLTRWVRSVRITWMAQTEAHQFLCYDDPVTGQFDRAWWCVGARTEIGDLA